MRQASPPLRTAGRLHGSISASSQTDERAAAEPTEFMTLSALCLSRFDADLNNLVDLWAMPDLSKETTHGIQDDVGVPLAAGFTIEHR